jgi:hypothetical protein
MTNIIDVLSFIHNCNQEEMNQLVLAIEKRKDRYYGERAKSIKEKKAIEWIGGRRLIKEAKFFLGDKQYQTLLEKGLVFENKEYVVVC